MAEKKQTMTDVEKPGSTPAPATSRPIITRRAPAVKDPMVNEQDSETKEPEPELKAPSAVKKTIQPLTPSPNAEEEKPAEAEKTEEEPLVPDDIAGEAQEEPTPNAEDAVSEEDRKRQELVDKLVVDKKYFVPIGAVQKRRSAQATIIFGVILVLLLAAILAIDAGLIDANITLPFDLIKNS